MRSKALILAAALPAVFFLATPADAASFDCARARAPDEVTVCRTPALSALDSEMGGLWYAYSRVPMYGRDRRAPGRGAGFPRPAAGLRAQDRLPHRRQRARIAALRRGIDESMRTFFRLQNGTDGR